MAAEIAQSANSLATAPRPGPDLRLAPWIGDVAVSRPGAGVAFALLNGALHAALIKVAVRCSDVDPRLATHVSRHVALHITLDNRASAYGVFCGNSLTVYGEKASDIRILLHQFQTIPVDQRAERLLQTVVHEMAHVWGHLLGVQTASRGGRYHPKRFGRLAEALGMVTERDEKYGLRTVAFTAKALREYADIVEDIDKALVVEMSKAEVRPARKAVGGEVSEVALPTHISGSCACTPPRTIRMTRTQWVAGPSSCEVCHQHYLAGGSVGRLQPVGVLAGEKVAGSIEKGNQ
jgi:hypothetical protein